MINQTLYAKYILERQGLQILEDESSFMFYKISNNELFLAEMFIEKSERATTRLKRMIDMLSQIGIESGCDVMTATIHLADPGCNHTLSSALKAGFKLARANNDIILISKELIGGL